MTPVTSGHAFFRDLTRVTPHSENAPDSQLPSDGKPLSAAEALRIASQLTQKEQDSDAIARAVLAMVGIDHNLSGDAAESALARAGVPTKARALLVAAMGPASDRPTVSELRAELELAVVTLNQSAARPTGISGLIKELRGRGVARTALWYIGGSVAVVEAANVFLPLLGAPSGIVRLLAILAVCGLPIALTLSWTFDVAPARDDGFWRLPRVTLIAGVSMLSLAVAALIWKSGRVGDESNVSNPRLLAPDPAHVAVLDFNTIGGDAEHAAFAAQLQARLIDGLSAAAMSLPKSQAPQLRVLSHAGVLPFVRSDFAVDSLREERGVGTVLEGTLIHTARSVRVDIRLIDTQTRDQISTSSAEIQRGDRIALLDAVADTVLRLVRSRLGPVVRDHIRLLETRSQDAFDDLIWATARLNDFQPAFAPGDFDTAERVLNDADSVLAAAEDLDPRWIEPIVERGYLAKRRVRTALARRDRSAMLAAIEQGIAHAERALSVNTMDVRALELRGDLRHFQLQSIPPATEVERERLHLAAEQDLRASLIGNPAPAKSLRLLSELAADAGRLQEALNYGTRAYAQDPFMEEVHFTVFRLFEYSFASHQDETAAHWCTQGKLRFADIPDQLPVFHDCRLALGAWSATHELSADSAWRLVDAELTEYPMSLRQNLEPRLQLMAAAVLARNGLADSARIVLRMARERDASPGVLRASAGVFALLGEMDSALAALHRLVRTTSSDPRALRNAPELRALMVDARARALIDEPPPNVR